MNLVIINDASRTLRSSPTSRMPPLGIPNKPTSWISTTTTRSVTSSKTTSLATSVETNQPNKDNPLYISPPVVFDHSFTLINDTVLFSMGGRFVNQTITNMTRNPYNDKTDFMFHSKSPISSSSSNTTSSGWGTSSNLMFLNASMEFEWYIRPDISIPPHIQNLTGHAAIALDHQQILVTFGSNSPSPLFVMTDIGPSIQYTDSSITKERNIVSIFDAVSFRWRKLAFNGTAPSFRRYHSIIYQESLKRVFILGGVLDSPPSAPITTCLAGAGRIDPTIYYLDLSMTAIGNATVLGTNSTESQLDIFPMSGTWNQVSAPVDGRVAQSGFAGQSSVLVNDTIVMCFGAHPGASRPTNLCTLFDTLSMNYIQPVYGNNSALPPSREGASMVYIKESRQIVLFGGMDLSLQSFMNDVWILDATVLPLIQWKKIDDMKINATTSNFNQTTFTTTTLRPSLLPSVLVTPSSSSNTAKILDSPSVLNVSAPDLGMIPHPRAFHGAVVFQDKKILVWGGYAPMGVMSSNLSVLDTEKWTWLPNEWQPKDGLMHNNDVIQVITYTGIAVGILCFVGFAVIAMLMGCRMFQSKLKQRKQGKSIMEQGLMSHTSFTTDSNTTCIASQEDVRPVQVLGMFDEDGMGTLYYPTSTLVYGCLRKSVSPAGDACRRVEEMNRYDHDIPTSKSLQDSPPPCCGHPKERSETTLVDHDMATCSSLLHPHNNLIYPSTLESRVSATSDDGYVSLCSIE